MVRHRLGVIHRCITERQPGKYFNSISSSLDRFSRNGIIQDVFALSYFHLKPSSAQNSKSDFETDFCVRRYLYCHSPINISPWDAHFISVWLWQHSHSKGAAAHFLMSLSQGLYFSFIVILFVLFDFKPSSTQW